MQRISFTGILVRFIAAFALVAATYNPTTHSFVHWIASTMPHVQPLQAVAGIVLLGLWIFFAGATWRSLGALGVILGLAFSAALVWLFQSMGWLSLQNSGAMAWVGITIVSVELTLGLCWGLLQTRITGQTVVEEVKR